MNRDMEINSILTQKRKQYRKCTSDQQALLQELFCLNKDLTSKYKKNKVKIYMKKIGNNNVLIVEFMGQVRILRCFTGNSGSHAIKNCSLDTSIKMLSDKGVGKNTCNTIRYMHYCDGTIDGSGKKEVTTTQFAKLHPKENQIKNNALQRKQKDILEFSLLTLVEENNNVRIDGIIHISDGKISYTTTEKIIKFYSKKDKPNSTYSASGIISMQKFTTSKSKTTKNGKHKTQYKIHNIERWINEINKYSEKKVGSSAKRKGDAEEIIRTKELNTNKNTFASTLKLDKFDIDDIYFCHTNLCHTSKDHGGKIQVKSDVVIIQSKDPNIQKLLLNHNNYLSETILRDNFIKFDIIPLLGISIKCGNGVTYQRHTRENFVNIYGISPEICAIASFYSTKEKDLPHNKHIWEQWCGNKPLPFDITNLEITKQKVKEAKNYIMQHFNAHPELKERIFTGKYSVDDKYVAGYMMWDGVIKEIDINDIHFLFNNGNGKKENSVPILQGNKPKYFR